MEKYSSHIILHELKDDTNNLMNFDLPIPEI